MDAVRALNIVTTRCYWNLRVVKFRKLLALIDKSVPETHDVHRILDSYGTYKTTLIHNWLRRRPRYHLHFTPISVSWLN